MNLAYMVSDVFGIFLGLGLIILTYALAAWVIVKIYNEVR